MMKYNIILCRQRRLIFKWLSKAAKNELFEKSFSLSSRGVGSVGNATFGGQSGKLN